MAERWTITDIFLSVLFVAAPLVLVIFFGDDIGRFSSMLGEWAANHPGLAWVGIGVLFVYFLPSVIAVMAGRKNALAIVALNVFLGWTFLGWLGSLIWSLVSETRINHVRVVPTDTPAPNLKHDDDIVGKLAKAAQLRADGHLSDEEFGQLKATILNPAN